MLSVSPSHNSQFKCMHLLARGVGAPKEVRCRLHVARVLGRVCRYWRVRKVMLLWRFVLQVFGLVYVFGFVWVFGLGLVNWVFEWGLALLKHCKVLLELCNALLVCCCPSSCLLCNPSPLCLAIGSWSFPVRLPNGHTRSNFRTTGARVFPLRPNIPKLLTQHPHLPLQLCARTDMVPPPAKNCQLLVAHQRGESPSARGL